MICEHFQRYKNDNGLGMYKIIQAHFVFCKTDEARKEKAKYSVCNKCHVPGLKLQACIYCMYFGCYTSKHIHEHAMMLKHNFAIDISYGSLYCFACKDNIYDDELDAIIRKYRVKHIKSLEINFPYLPWEPDNDEIELIKKHTTRMCVTENSYLGLRGILNLGKTCYLNCIVQVLTHTPVLRDYFLSDRHICQYPSDIASKCLMCEMATLCQEFYTEKMTPYIPNHLLYLVWTHNRQLVGNKEQDAHEFFLFALDILHKYSKGIILNNMSDIDFEKCDCIVDQVFTGTMQSIIQCKKCLNISPKIDSFRDIALEIVKLDGENRKTTLEDCLERFTMVEDLKQVWCKKCEMPQPTTKQLKIKRLPIIASFHLKRFGQKYDASKKNNGTKRNKNSTKIQTPETYVSTKNRTDVLFPKWIDLSPFTMFHSEQNYPYSNFDSKYRLFAVVEHSGDCIENGHYISYIRLHKDQWFKCSDLDITGAAFEDVLKSEGYVLFYHKNSLEYE